MFIDNITSLYPLFCCLFDNLRNSCCHISTYINKTKNRYFFILIQIYAALNFVQIMTPPHERRNFSKIYEKMKLSELSALVPDFNFTQYLDTVVASKISPENDIVIYASKYFKKLTQIIKTTERRVLANYILMRFIRHRINNLDKR